MARHAAYNHWAIDDEPDPPDDDPVNDSRRVGSPQGMLSAIRNRLAASLLVVVAVGACIYGEYNIPMNILNETSETIEIVHVTPDGLETTVVPRIAPAGEHHGGDTPELHRLCQSGELVARAIADGRRISSVALPRSDYSPCGQNWSISDESVESP